MAFQIIAVLAFIGAASALYAPSTVVAVDGSLSAKSLEESDSNPQYAFTYGVHDTVSGDVKNHFESRNGNVVRGVYSLNDPDGYKRTVDYTADDINGFNAVVDRKPIVSDAPVVPEPVVVKPVAAPVFVKTLSPVTYAVSSGPSYVQSIPASYVTRSVYQPTLAYGRQVGVFPITYSGPTLIKSAPIAYAGPVTYALHALK